MEAMEGTMGTGRVANPDRSEFHTVGAATPKPREGKVVGRRGTDNRLAFAECKEYVGMW